jgi:hypothetical protein
MAICLVLRARWMMFLVFFLAPFKASSVVNFSLGGVPSGLQAGYFAALVFFVKLLLDGMTLGRIAISRDVLRLFSMLFFFAVFATLTAIVLPVLFRGSVEVYPLDLGLRDNDLTILTPRSGNFTQTVYLIVNVILAAALANLIVTGKDFMFAARAYVITSVFVIFMGIYQLLAHYGGFYYPYDVITNNPGYSQQFDQQILGLKRYSSVFTEPSAAAHWLVGFIPFAIVAYLRGLFGKWLLWVILIAAGCLVFATSTTGYAAAALLLGYVGIRALARSAHGVPVFSQRAVALGVAFLFAGVVALGWLWTSGIFELVSSVFDKAIITKLASESGVRRLGGDAHALWLMIETGGLGVGWGGNKASSQLMRVASTTGLMGLLIIAYFIVGLIRQNRRVQSLETRGSQLASLISANGWAVTGMFLAALIAAGDPNALGFWIGLAMYVAALAGAAKQEGAGEDLQATAVSGKSGTLSRVTD